MGYTLRVESLADASAKDTWNRLRSTSPVQSPFSNPDFIVALWTAVGAVPKAVFLENSNQVDLALVLFDRKRGPFSSTGLAPFVPFTPLVLSGSISESDNNLRKSAWDDLHAHLAKNYHDVRIHLPTGISDPRVLAWNGWSITPLFTSIAELPSSSQASSWSKGTAQLFEKNVDAYRVVQRNEDSDLAARHIANSYERNNRKLPVSRPVLSTLIENVVASDLGTIYFAEHISSSKTDAAVVALRDGTQACYWLAGSEKGAGMTVLIGRMLEDLASGTCSHIDFVGSNTPGIAEFKRHFNAQLTSYYACSLQSSRLLRLLNVFRG